MPDLEATLYYRGYQASVKKKEGYYIIHLINTPDLIMAQCDSEDGIKPSFEELVDDYIATNRDVGR